MTQEMKETIIEYLETVNVLISVHSDMEDIIYQRDKHYGQEEKIKKCIEVIKDL